MRILQIVHGFPPESNAGTEQYCAALCRQLRHRGHAVAVLAGTGRSALRAMTETVEQDGCEVRRYLRAEDRCNGWVDESGPEAEAALHDILASFRPDVVHVQHWHRLTRSLVAICAPNAPVIVTLHDCWISCPRIHRIRNDGSYCAEPLEAAPCLECVDRISGQTDQDIVAALTLRRQMIEAELSLASVLIAPSQAHRALLCEQLAIPEDRMIVLPHGIPWAIWDPVKRHGTSTYPNRPLQIGHWGHLLHHKGTHLLLEAVHQLRDPLAVDVHLIGAAMEEPYAGELRNLARDISVQFHGPYQPADLQMFDLDLAVFPSITSESYSFTVDEALQLGLPVLVADRGALPERIGTAGRIFRAEDAGDLARCLQDILDAPETLRVMSLNIRLERHCSMPAHAAIVETIYEDAIHTGRLTAKPPMPYLKLLLHVRQQLLERDRMLAAVRVDLERAQQAVQRKDADLQHSQRVVNSLRNDLEQQRQRVAELEKGIGQRDVEVRRYREALEAILSSTTWKLTAPIRWIRHPLRALTGRDQFTNNRARLMSTIGRCYSYYRKTGLKATARRIIAEVHMLSDKSPHAARHSPELFNIDDIHPLSGDISSSIAVHVHVHYPDVIAELAGYLKHMPFAFDLFVSVSTDEARDSCCRAFSGLPRVGRVTVDVVENRGRDIAPLICHFGAGLATYDYICHVHTKKSVYAQGRMNGWREYLFRQLLGTEDQIRRIFSVFEKDRGAGIIYPQNYAHLPYWGNTWLSNRALGFRMCRQMGITDMPDGYFDYPAGSMFWARGTAIQHLFSAGIRPTDFPEETGQTDGSLAHCIERLLALVVKHAGYKPLILQDPFAPSWSKWRFDRYMTRTVDDVNAMLDAQDIKVIAFDIFETLLIRPVIHPEAVKTIIGRRSGNMAGGDYIRLRAHAEERARSRSGRDVGLEEIYAEFASLTGKSVDEVRYLRALEEDIELHLVAPRSECIDLANHAMRSGKRVVLVSDMFLPRGVIEKILSENGIAGYHALYLSSDLGVRKDTGELYRLLLEREQIAPNELLMVGDNEHSDVQIPLNLGSQVCHVLRPVEIARAMPRFSGILEWAQTKGDLSEQLTLGLVIRKLFGPVFYRSLDPAGLVAGGAEQIGYAVAGPIIVSFCLWLIDTAKKDGIEKLFFLAREGRLLKTVYDQVAMHVEDAIPSEYLVLSRRAVTVPMIESIDDIFRIAGDSDYFPNELREFLKYRYGLILEDDALHDLYARGLWKKGELVEVAGDIRRLKPVLEALSENIIGRGRMERPGLALYVRNIGLQDVASTAVVDVGYSATIQGLLSGFLKKPIQGYYMLTSARSSENCSRHNIFARGYYGHQIERGESGVSPLWRRSFELETFLSSNDPQVICYVADESGELTALYQERSVDEQQSFYTRADIHRGITSFVDDFLSLKNSVYPELALPPTLPEMLFREFVEHMSNSEREILSALVLDDHYCGRGIVALG